VVDQDAIDGRGTDPGPRLFNLAIDSKLRGCDVVALKVDDVAPTGYTIERATVRQRKTGRPVKFELSDRRLLASIRQKGRRVSVCEQATQRSLHDDTPIRAPRV
jgi:hypothetical protein